MAQAGALEAVWSVGDCGVQVRDLGDSHGNHARPHTTLPGTLYHRLPPEGAFQRKLSYRVTL